MDVKKFFDPSWKKLKWFFIVFFVAQLYSFIIMPAINVQIIQGFINFVLNPATIIFDSQTNAQLLQPVILTLNAVWNYFLATILAKEIEHEK